MTRAAELPEAIRWHEGMLLAPQHFQQASLRQEMLVHYHVQAAAPFHWGVRRLEINRNLLTGGTFRVTELEAVLPDGLAVSYPARGDEPLQVDLKPLRDLARQLPLTIHLAVPVQRPEGESPAGRLERHRAVPGEGVLDEHGDAAPVEVPRLRPHLVLLAVEAPPEKYVTISLARVRFADEAFVPAEYVPPLLAASGETWPGRQCAALAVRVREKALFLADRVSASRTVERDPQMAEMEGAMRALSAGLPHLEALVAAGSPPVTALSHPPHPFQLFLSLCSLAGHLAGLGPVVPPRPPRYDHADLLASFGPMLAFCNRMVDGVQEQYAPVPFQFREGAFGLPLRDEWTRPPVLLGVLPQPGMSEAEVLTWMEESRIGSRSRMPSLRDRRIRGADRRRVGNPAREFQLAPGQGVLVFALRTDEDFIVSGEELEIAHPAPGKLRPQEIVLYTQKAP
ncbi:MAG TPA: type VI secretion system baseplate subunit TssK [Longimicrobiaceae bacterium]